MSSRYRASEEWVDSMILGGSAPSAEDNDSTVKRRLVLYSIGLVLLFTGLFGRLAFLQVFDGQALGQEAESNRIRTIVEYAPRGRILDRDGKIIADNTLTFELLVTPVQMNADEGNTERVKNMLKRLGIDANKFFKQANSYGEDYVLPVPIAHQLGHEEAIKAEAMLSEISGVVLNEVPVRKYDARAGLGVVVGYVSRVSEEDLDSREDLLPTDFVGRAGVEAQYDEMLRGRNGYKRVEVDALGRPIRLLSEIPAQIGQDINLSIDLDAQLAMAKAMREQMKKANSRRGAGVAVDPSNGEVLAMVSMPYYDNNFFSRNFTEKEYSELINHPEQLLYNKVTQGGHPTGSIIKPLVASAALTEGVVTPETIIVDRGAIDAGGGFIFRGWRPEGLGPMNVRRAIAWSSNIYFYTVGGGHGGIEGLGEERLTHYYRMFGLGEYSGIDIPEEIEGRVPDNEWKLETKGEPWYLGDSYNISIGQGDMLVSPLQITMAEAAIANNGYLLQPQVLRDLKRNVRREIDIPKNVLKIVREGMRQVLTGGTTCECLFQDVPHKVAGKSGTAETNTPGDRPPHAWFTAFAPYGTEPRFLATVLIEEGSGGSLYAAPVIAETMESYFKSR